MWSSEEHELTQTEALIRDAAWMPQPTSVFRARVLSTVVRQQRQSRRSERFQILAALTLAATVLWCLPGWLSSATVVPHPAAGMNVESAETTIRARSWSLIDDYEWGLVQAALAKQSHSAVLIQGLL